MLVVAPLARSAPAPPVESAPSFTGSPPAIARRRTGAALAVPRAPAPTENWHSFLLPCFTHACWRAAAPTVAELNTILLFNVAARDSVVFHDEIHAARPAQILVRVDLVIVIAPACEVLVCYIFGLGSLIESLILTSVFRPDGKHIIPPKSRLMSDSHVDTPTDSNSDQSDPYLWTRSGCAAASGLVAGALRRRAGGVEAGPDRVAARPGGVARIKRRHWHAGSPGNAIKEGEIPP